jgi:hypothetical protein
MSILSHLVAKTRLCIRYGRFSQELDVRNGHLVTIMKNCSISRNFFHRHRHGDNNRIGKNKNNNPGLRLDHSIHIKIHTFKSYHCKRERERERENYFCMSGITPQVR